MAVRKIRNNFAQCVKVGNFAKQNQGERCVQGVAYKAVTRMQHGSIIYVFSALPHALNLNNKTNG